MNIMSTRPAFSANSGIDPSSGWEQKPSAQIWTADRLRIAVNGFQGLSGSERRSMLTAINHTEAILTAQAALIETLPPWSCAALNQVLWSRPSLAFGLTGHAFRDALSGLRRVLIRVGLHANAGYGRNSMSPAWQALHAALPTPERRYGLLSFFRFCTLQGYEPAQVPPDALDRFEAWCATAILHADPGKAGRRTAGNWEFARTTVSGWPEISLTRTDMRDHYGIPLERFPRSFQKEVERYLDRLATGPQAMFKGGNPFAAGLAALRLKTGPQSPRSVPRALTPRTIETRRWQIKIAATALIQSGIPIEQITSLTALVQPFEHILKILSFHRERARERMAAQGQEVTEDDLRSSNLAGLGELLRQLAVFEAKLPGAEIDALKDYLALLRPEVQQQMTEKNATRLRSLLAEPTYSRLLHLPQRWLEEARNPALKPRAAALLAMFGAALEILLFLPIRRHTLLQLTEAKHLRRPRPYALINELTVPAKLVKNRIPLFWPVDPDSARRLDVYLRQHRPTLCSEANPFLFPGLGMAARNEAQFGDDLSKAVAAEIGAEFNMHLVRHFAAVRYLRANPGAYEVTAMFLGHKNPETTRRFYAGLEIDAAARHANANLAGERNRTEVLALGFITSGVVARGDMHERRTVPQGQRQSLGSG